MGVRVDRVDPSASNMPKHEPLALGAVPNSVVLWQAEPKAQDAERYYNFRYRTRERPMIFMGEVLDLSPGFN